MTKVLLIEDEEGLGEPLLYQLDRSGYTSEWVRDGREGLERFERMAPDLVLLDLMLPSLSGEEVCTEIRRRSNVPIIMLTAKDAEVDKIVGLELGADDYVTKPFSTRELLSRIKAVLRRARSGAPQTNVIELGGIRLDAESFEVTVRGEPIHLPRKEFELLEMLMTNAGRVVTREELIDTVWGGDYVGDTRTLDVHIKRLRARCEEDPKKPAHIVTVRGWGYKFVP